MNNQAYISQVEAQRRLRAKGFSVAVSKESVGAMVKKQFGLREKVKASDVHRLIEEAEMPTPAPAMRSIRPIKWRPEDFNARV